MLICRLLKRSMMDAPTAALIGSGIAGLVSIVAIISNVYLTNRNLRHSAVKDIAKVSVELKIQQLNELYGPLLHLTEQNFRLAQKLREGKPHPENWRLLDHLPQVLSDPRDGPLAKAILEIDAKTEELIISKGGLVRGPTPPASFASFLAHYRLLKLMMQGAKIAPSSDEYYPRRFDEDVKADYEEIKKEVSKMLSRYEELLSEFAPR